MDGLKVSARWAWAVYLFLDDAGRPSTARDAHRVTVGVTTDWRVSVIVPDELAAVAPEFAVLLGERVAEAQQYARRRAEVAAAVASGP
jgi:hypothetical protein